MFSGYEMLPLYIKENMNAKSNKTTFKYSFASTKIYKTGGKFAF